MIFASTDKNKEALENYTELWDEIKNQIETMSGDKPIKYGRNFMKIKFESLESPSGKILSIPVCIIAVRSVFKKTTNIIHKFIYMNVCINMSINSYASKFQALLCISYIKFLLYISYIKFLLFIVFYFFYFFPDKISIFKLFYASVT